MQLRGERNIEQLTPVLHARDAEDVIAAPAMHIHCSRVARAYTLAVDDDTPFWASRYSDADTKPQGYGSLYISLGTVDLMDSEAQKAVAISEFRSSLAYVNHLRIFLYIWILFLPLALVSSSGWFTPLWAVLIAHGIGMLFNIASMLNDPFGFDVHDIKLNRLCATAALSLLDIQMKGTVKHEYLVDEMHDTPTWLDDAYADHLNKQNNSGEDEETAKLDTKKTVKEEKTKNSGENGDITRRKSIVASFFSWKPALVIPMGVFIAWCLFIVFFTWGLTRNDAREPDVRWWDIYIPLDSSTASYVSLGIFLLLGFWMSDAYGRYWTAIDIWQSLIPSYTNDIVLYMLTTLRAGLFHTRDHERLLSFVAALPFVAKQQLRDSTNYNDLDGMLSAKDITRIQQESNPTGYVFEVIKGYLHSADSCVNVKIDPEMYPCMGGMYHMVLRLQELEDQFFHCMALQQIPIPHAFTSHLYLFTVFWLALLPLTLVLHDGFIAFVYLVPVGYSIINLLIVGKEMSDPFGTDVHDLPLDLFCREMKQSVRDAYIATRDGPTSFVRNTGQYDRLHFTPTTLSSSSTAADSNPSGPTPLSSLRAMLRNFPSVSPFAIAASMAWAVIAVFVSKALADNWGEVRRDDCPKWCSPIDVQGSVLANIGFALFMILGFRAADALSRYGTGADLLQSMRMRLRDYALDIVMYFDDEEFHVGDKERVIAHIAQVPICFRDMMLGGDDVQQNNNDKSEQQQHPDTLLNDEDYNRFLNAPSPIEYLFQTMSAYMAIQDVSFRDTIMLNGRPGPTGLTFNYHVQTLRTLVAKACTVKRFPVIRSYTNHQHLFTLIWLVLLPLAMTSTTGYFTILWAPLISYGVLCLESIAVKLVDPYGTDDIDLPVKDICEEMVTDVLDVVRGVEWGVSLARESSVDSSAVVHTGISGRSVCANRTVLNINGTPLPGVAAASSNEKGDDVLSMVRDTSRPMAKPKPTLYAHLLRSVPWWTLIVITTWTAVGCLISFLSRDKTMSVRWWVSNFSVSTDVGTYLSFLAFTLLGFYVNEAFARYNTAGNVWDYSLRKGCHIITNYFLSAVPADCVHNGDHSRLVAHIAALPLVLKAELRDSRDLREVSGLLSNADVGLIQRATSMSRHCLDVIVTYWCANLKRPVGPKCTLAHMSTRVQMLRSEIRSLELAVNKALFVKNFPIAPGFIIVLNALLGIFFLVLPFILAEVTGWLSILWVPIVAYGVFGMYKVAGELQDPFGTDLNDLDLDTMADKIAREVLFVFKQQKTGHTSLICKDAHTTQFWTEDKRRDDKLDRNVFNEYDALPRMHRFLYSLKLAVSAVPAWLLTASTAWAAVAVLVAYLISEHLPQTGGNDDCEWFCSAIAIDSSVQSYVGFALFLLLGFFLYDSHWRYVYGLELWRSQLVDIFRTTANRLFQSYYAGFWHEGDLERVAGHFAAAVISLKGDLRGAIDKERLARVLCEDDVTKVIESADRIEYCFDVLRSYMMHSELVDAEAKARQPAPSEEHFILGILGKNIGNAAFQCRRIVAIPLPFGYVQHLRIFLAIWLLLFPLGIVENTGWIAVLWTMIISYGIIGVERWAEKLSDPFGDDLTDLPLDAMTDDIVDTVRETLQAFEKDLDLFIYRDRLAALEVEGSEEVMGGPGAQGAV